MESLGLLVGHMLGDYILQNDWQAKNKVNPWPKPREWIPDEGGGHCVIGTDEEEAARSAGFRGHLACTIHCLLYTFAVWVCSFWWMPGWGLAVCFLTHWPIDRLRLAGVWMRNISGQKDFATGPLSPWSIIVVDNTFHLLTLFAIGVAHSRL